MNDLLLISYDFSENLVAGSLRARSFRQYLPAHGWAPHVLTASPPDEQPDMGWLPGSATHIASLGHRIAGGRATETGAAQSITGQNPPWVRALAGLKKVLPIEREMGWWPNFFREALAIGREKNVKAVLTTCPPYVAMAFGHWLARLLRVPHVIDLRDDWFGTPRYAARTRSSRLLLDGYAGHCVRQAAAVTVASPRAVKGYDQFGVPVYLVRNGFLEEDFTGVSMQAGVVERTGPLRIMHLGWIYGDRPIGPLLRAVARLKSEIPDLDRHLRIVQYGLIDPDQWAVVQDASLEGVVEVKKQIPHREALAEMQQSDVLLCIASMGTPTAVPGKLYEYLRARRPLWLLADDCASRDVAADTGIHWLDAPADVDALYRTLKDLLAEKAKGCLRTHTDPVSVAGYARTASAAVMAEVLDKAVTASREQKADPSAASFKTGSSAGIGPQPITHYL